MGMGWRQMHVPARVAVGEMRQLIRRQHLPDEGTGRASEGKRGRISSRGPLARQGLR